MLKNKSNRRDSIKMMLSLGAVSLFPFKLLSCIKNKTCEVCKKAWESLGKFPRTRYQFRYIEPVASLPNVFIYGDSISIHYTEYVRASLEGKASVYRLHKNGNSSDKFIRNMETFKETMFQPNLEGGWDFSWDVIHFNVGLHDFKYMVGKKRDKVNGTQVSPPEVYKENLEKIIAYLKTNYPNAKLIFATTTPVPDGEAGRIEGDAIRYNELALKVLEKHKDIIVNDLYTVSVPVQKEHSQGDVHYKPEGSRIQGIEVAKVIANTLNIETVECPSVDTIVALSKEYESKKKKRKK